MAKSAITGNHGERVRSDCRVELNLTSSGGIDISLNSKAGILYDASIRELTRRVLDHFGIVHASVRIDDSGALDFVIAARIEAGIKKIRETDRDFFLNAGLNPVQEGNRNRFRFTRLYLPGNAPSFMINAGIHRPDGIILDLEDSVAPDRKEEARILVRNALRDVDFLGAERMVRINQLPAGLLDLDSVIPQYPDLILVPKTEDPDQIRSVDNRIREILGEKKREIFLMPIIESALGIERAFKIAGSSPNVIAMAIGLEDYTADLGVSRTQEGSESLYARLRLVNACKAAGIQAIDSVYSDLENEIGLKETVVKSRALGFEGMGCIHPRQIPVIREAFRPSREEIHRAGRIVQAYEHAEREGLGVVSLDSKMIDPPVVKRALQTIELALKLKMIPQNWRETDE
jgi:citrate lyase subunit beta/citryl-CoA lyase